jgi:hypothetical protein
MPDDVITRAIRLFGGDVIDPLALPRTEQGFQGFLAATGVRHFTASEVVRPKANRRALARSLGYELLLPEQAWWPRGAALLLLADELRRVVNEPVACRNWWRPGDYNAAVGGAPEGDHPSAHAVDLDYRSETSRRKAEGRLRELDREQPWLRLSLGLGARTTHVGIDSPKGRREWHYAGWDG